VGLAGQDPRIVGPHRVLRRVADQHSVTRSGEYQLQLQHVTRAEKVVDLRKVAGKLFGVAL